MPALQFPSGRVSLKHRRLENSVFGAEIELPCGSCEGCRSVRIKNWAIRGYHESLTNTRLTSYGPVINGCFVTLTYDEDNVPSDYSLRLADWKSFCKKLRRDVGKFRFLACGEYGPKGQRPHFHACIYGIDFHEDREICATSTAKKDSVEWTSNTLSRTWKRGFCTLGPLSFATASYTAGYVMKKLSGAQHLQTNAIYGADSRPILLRKQEFNVMSKNPGLGAKWFEKYWSDVYPEDCVHIEGKTYRPPSYYDELLLRRDPALHHQVLTKRREFLDKRGLSTEYEIAARAAIFASKTEFKKSRGDL